MAAVEVTRKVPSFTAAITPPNRPTELIDFTWPSGWATGWPARFLETTEAEDAYVSSLQSAHPGAYLGIQPTALVALPDGAVLVFYNELLTLETMAWQLLGTGVARLTLDLTVPLGSRPLIAERVADDVFSLAEPAFGQGAAYDGGYVYAVGCERRVEPSCFLGRAAATSVTDRTAWRFWTGSTWSSTVGSATPVALAGIANEHAQIGLAKVGALGQWVISTTPMPGFTEQGLVSFAPSLTSPWSAPQTYQLPGCGRTITTNCYGMVVHAELSSGTALGVTYFSLGSRRTERATLPLMPA
jgi:hypothetical protein